MKRKVEQYDIFTDEWKFLFAYCSAEAGKTLVAELFPDVDYNYIFDDRRGATFFKRNKVPLIWINSDKVKGKQKLWTTIHESYHLVKCIGEWIGINDEEWFAETLEFVVRKISSK
jgi:hypothetical protein